MACLTSFKSKDGYTLFIRDIGPADRKEVLKLIRSAISGGDADCIASAPNLTGYVAVNQGGGIVGALTYKTDPVPISSKATETGELTALAVLQLWERKRVGQNLWHFFRQRHSRLRVRMYPAKEVAGRGAKADADPYWRSLGCSSDSDVPNPNKGKVRGTRLRSKPLLQ